MDRIERLLRSGYLPSQLPPSFTTVDLAVNFMSDRENVWRKKGWYSIAPGACQHLFETYNRAFSFHAHAGDRVYGIGGKVDCVVFPGPFDVTLSAPVPGENCPPNMTPRPFQDVMMPEGALEHTINLGE